MRFLRIPLMVAGGAALVLALGFFFQMPWAKNLWPLPDGRLSYAFMASILAGTAIPLIWIGLAREWGALVGYAFGFGCMYGAMALYAFLLYGEHHRQPLLVYGCVTLALTVLCLLLLRGVSRSPIVDARQAPRVVRLAFFVEILRSGAGAGSARSW
jgi:hypothetical protein